MIAPKERKFAIITISIAVFVCLLVTEGILRLLEKLPEKMYLDYGDMVDGKQNPGGGLKPNFDEQVIDSAGNQVRMKTNSAGFRNNREFAGQPPAGVTRILSLGDSFTAGYRLGQADTYTHLLETALNEEGLNVEMPLGLMDDPNQSLAYFKTTGLAYNPHAVLQGITIGNDFLTTSSVVHRNWAQISTRKIPAECQIPKTRWNKIKWWANYGRYHVRVARLLIQPNRAITTYFRNYMEPVALDGLHGLGLFLKDPPVEVTGAYEALLGVLKTLHENLKQQGVPIWFIIFPQRFQIHDEDWAAAVTEYMLKPECFDLSLPNRRIKEFCSKNNMTCLDPTESMRKTAQSNGEKLYIANGDMHWNPAGNRALTQAIYESIKKFVTTLRN